MGTTKKLAGLGLVPLMVCLVAAQEKAGDVQIISRVPNFPKIARLWNSLGPVTREWNVEMEQAQNLLKERFNPKILLVDPEQKRRQTVAHLKAAREALLKELDTLNELIDEEDY